MSKTLTRIWIGCVACYSNGHLTGEWFNAIDAPTEPKGFTAKLRQAPFSHSVRHDELWVMAHEGFEGLLSGSSEFLPEIGVKVAQLIQAIEADGLDPVVVGRWVRHEDKDVIGMNWPQAREEFQDAYAGCFGDLGEYAAQTWDGNEALESLPDELRQNIDWDGVGRDAEFNGTIYSIETGIKETHVFTI